MAEDSMVAMFFTPPPPMTEIMDNLADLEARIRNMQP